MVQWLKPRAPNVGHLGSIPGRITRSHMPQRRSEIMRAATKTQCSQINNLKKKKRNSQKINPGEESRELSYTVGGNVKWYIHCGEKCRTVLLKKLKIELPYDPATLFLDINPEKNGSKGYMHPSVHHSTVYNSQDMEAT